MKTLILVLSSLLILSSNSCKETEHAQGSQGSMSQQGSQTGNPIQTSEIGQFPTGTGAGDYPRITDVEQQHSQTPEELYSKYEAGLARAGEPENVEEYSCVKDDIISNIVVREFAGEPGKGDLLCEYIRNGKLWYFANNDKDFCRNKLNNEYLPALISDGHSCSKQGVDLASSHETQNEEEVENDPPVTNGDNSEGDQTAGQNNDDGQKDTEGGPATNSGEKQEQ